MAAETVFPIAMGNEEETGMLVTGNHPGDMGEPYYFATHLREFIPDDLHHAGEPRIFLSNGGLVYMGGASDREEGAIYSTNIERATPECPDPETTATYIDAHEKVIVEMSKKYAELQANALTSVVEVRIQRRSVDADGNRKGAHDSYGYSEERNIRDPFKEPRGKQAFLGFLATRSFMTGAGYVNAHGGLRFSQKADGLISEEGYGYFGTMYRVAEGEPAYGTGRIETRMNDVNISPWATKVRLGGVGLLLAMAQTDLVEDLPIYEGGINHTHVAKRVNGLRFDKDGQLIARKEHFEALDFQQRVAELAQDKLQLYADVPDKYYRIAREMHDYCEDFRDVLKSEKPFNVLADRSDAFAKFKYIQRRVRQDETDGLSRTMTDMKARMHDMQYDFIDVHALPYAPAVAAYGVGYRLRDKGHFRMSHTKADVERAYHQAPKGMRGQVRTRAMRDYDMSGHKVTMDWHEMRVDKGVDGNRGVSLGPVASDVTLLSTRKFLETTFPRRTKQ